MRHHLLQGFHNDPQLLDGPDDRPFLIESASLQEILVNPLSEGSGADITTAKTGSVPVVTLAKIEEIRVWQLSMLRDLTTPLSKVHALATVPHTQPTQLLLGRSDTCDIVVKEGSVSKKHARFDMNARCIAAVVDLGSSNGTRVNKQTIAPDKPHTLTFGDCLCFGRAVFYLVPARMLRDLIAQDNAD